MSDDKWYVVGYRDWQKEDCCLAMHDVSDRELLFMLKSHRDHEKVKIFEITPQSAYPKLAVPPELRKT